MASPSAPLEPGAIGPSLSWAALVAGLVACGLPLGIGLSAGWSGRRALLYFVVAVVYLLLTQIDCLPFRTNFPLRHTMGVYLGLVGVVGFVLQSISGDPFVQPIVFTIPLVRAALVYPAGRTTFVAICYLGLMILGLWSGGERDLAGLLIPTASYGALMVFMYNSTRLAVREAAAHQRANQLANDLSRERDQLQRLVDENIRLNEQARLSATLAERNRLARELHDTIAQGLTAVTMQLEAAQRSWERDPARSRSRLERAYTVARETLDDVRRSVWTLASPLVDGETLGEAIEERVGDFARRSGLRVAYRHTGPPPRLPHAAATQLLRIIQEALQNVEKHASASEVVVDSEVNDVGLHLRVADNGIGFNVEDAPLTVGAHGGGFGLRGMQERARLAGGRLSIESAPGAGACVSITIPLTSATGDR